MGFSQYVGAPKQVSFVDSSQSTTQTLAIPGGVVANDIAVVFDYIVTGTLITATGFTEIVSSSSSLGGTFRALRASYRVLSAGDITAGSITLTNGSVNRKMGLFFRCDSSISSITVSTPSEEAGNTDPTPQNVDADTQAPPVIVIGVMTDSPGLGNLADVSSVPAFDAEIVQTVAPTTEAGYSIHNSTPVDHVISGTGNNVMMLQSFYLKVN